MADLTWFPFSLMATVCFGVAMAFYKLPFAKGQSRYAVSFWQLFFNLLLSLIFFYNYIPLANIGTIFYGSAWGLSFLLLSLLQMKALKDVDTNMLFPITTSLSLIITVLFGIYFFKDHISLIQIIGMFLAVIAVSLFSYKGKRLQYSKKILVLGLGVVFLSFFGKIIQKFAADGIDIRAFQIYEYLSAVVFSLMLNLYIHKKEFKQHLFSNSIKSGVLIGIPSFLGGYMLLIALTKGPFPLITSIHSLYVLITAMTAYFIFKEKLSLRKIILIITAIIATILIKIG